MIIPTEINSRLSVPRRIMLSSVASYTPWRPHIQALAGKQALDLGVKNAFAMPAIKPSMGSSRKWS